MIGGRRLFTFSIGSCLPYSDRLFFSIHSRSKSLVIDQSTLYHSLVKTTFLLSIFFKTQTSNQLSFYLFQFIIVFCFLTFHFDFWNVFFTVWCLDFILNEMFSKYLIWFFNCEFRLICWHYLNFRATVVGTL